MYSDFVEAMKKMIKSYINKIHTALPGEIKAVNAEKGTADVQPIANVKLTDGTVVEYPLICNVPIYFPHSSQDNASFAFPVTAGDQCLIVFSEQSTQYWLGISSITDEFKYSLSSAICIPGLMKTAATDFTEAVNSDSVIIRNGDSKITLSKSAIIIRGDVTVDGNLSITGGINGS